MVTSNGKNPIHIGIIMDGNGRWAQMRGRPRTFGHIKGARVAKKIITRCMEEGVETLTLFAFSTENWLRPQIEVNFLMTLLKRYLVREADTLVKENIRFLMIGDPDRVPADLMQIIRATEARTATNDGLNLIFALNYGSRAEITAAVQKIATEVADGILDPSQITEQLIQKHLQTAELRDPDLIIRTSGETRISNFLLWQAAYSEFYFSPVLWPDFTVDHLMHALQEFQLRERRYGGFSAPERQIEV
jgi:undecaprenyl diphosphate synthase